MQLTSIMCTCGATIMEGNNNYRTAKKTAGGRAFDNDNQYVKSGEQTTALSMLLALRKKRI